MVEMKYDETKNNLKLPKNIRQVGKPGEKIKIYVEDYVITYINQIARESAEQQRLAVLLGKIGKVKEDTVAFIDGAVEAKGVVVQEDQVVFTSEIWTKIYEEIGQYFHNTQVVGWFLTRPGKSLGINDKITKIHVDNFPGADKALFIIDPQDHDEAFYIYDQGELVRQDGYYIYYERNEDMQNYMVDHKTGESSEQQAGNAFLRKKEEILERRQAQKKDSGKLALFSKLGTPSVKKNEEEKTEEPKADAAKIEPSKAKDQPAEDKKQERGFFAAAAAKSRSTDPGEDSAGQKDKGFSGDLFKGMKRASSLVVTFAILFALIFGFTQLNRRQTQEVSNTSGNDVTPVDVAEGDLTPGNDADAANSADGAAGTTDMAAGDDAGGTLDMAAGDDGSGALDMAAGDDAGGATDMAGNDDAGAVTDIDGAYAEDEGMTSDGTDAIATGSSNTGADSEDRESTDDGSIDDSQAETEVMGHNVIRQYEVREGDTLAGISEKFYNDYKYIEMIQEMNQIEDPDMIYPGMMLDLPEK